MKKHVHIYSISILCFFFVLGGCVKKTPIEEERSKSTHPATGQNDDAVLLDLPADKEIVPAKYPVQDAVIGNDDVVLQSTSETAVETDTLSGLMEHVPVETDSINSQAFRIQIFTSKVYGEARYARQIAEEIFDRPVYLDYEVPYFKVRVGSFGNRDDAEQYLPRVRAAGYKDAWVVMTIVSVHEAAPLYLHEQPEVSGDSTGGQYESLEE